jgi:aspartate/methionine/tyrosine aminotransferase
VNIQDNSTSQHLAFRRAPFMGVIYVVHRASELGFYNGNPDWSNLGQGQPEVGPLDGAPDRISKIELQPTDQAYGPINGSVELRKTVAAHYNRLFRSGKESQYTY